MKNFLLKLKSWLTSQPTQAVVLMIAALFALIAVVVLWINPKQFNTLTVFIFLSYGMFLVYDFIKSENELN